jgi:peptidoglycan hydrolase-like protein with peptidoglycan-binding domain
MQNILELAATRLGEPYILGSMVPKDDVDYHGPWDCAEFCSWAIYQVSAKLYGCVNNSGNPATADAYTGFWKRDADKIGDTVPIEVAAKTPGAFLLRYSGPGVTGHVVMSDGKGGTIEAHSHKDGVIRSKVSGRRWDIGILIPWLSHEFTEISVPVEAPKEMIYRWTEPMMTGEVIKKIQLKLGQAPDGIFGSKTFYAVKQFQNKMGLVSDGEVGPQTLSALGVK